LPGSGPSLFTAQPSGFASGKAVTKLSERTGMSLICADKQTGVMPVGYLPSVSTSSTTIVTCQVLVFHIVWTGPRISPHRPFVGARWQFGDLTLGRAFRRDKCRNATFPLN